ncbi:hypothetical protein GWK47_024436 [Chionoecetes opilio]|uniref:Uncharacterized protein n=1 Tax=Chionoecetes opilio TaxID=41210 RepID=A0A8J4XL86_CHIOP|nr:hypothetical protein GWK47_024436 [Chionoecetes opilio]
MAVFINIDECVKEIDIREELHLRQIDDVTTPDFTPRCKSAPTLPGWIQQAEDDVNVFASQSAVSVEILRDTPPCARRKSISADYSNSLGARGGRGLRRSSIYVILTPLDLRFFAGSGPRSVNEEREEVPLPLWYCLVRFLMRSAGLG